LEDGDADSFTKSTVPHQYALAHGADEPFVAEIPNARVASIQSLVFDQHNFYLDTYHNATLIDTILPVRPPTVDKLDGGYVTADLSDKPQIDCPGPALLLSSPHPGNYHHWLLETLPRLWVLGEYEEYKAIPIILPIFTHSFQPETLSKFIPNGHSVIFSGPWVLNIERLVFPSYLAPGGHSRVQLDWLRSRFCTREGSPERLIYVSRKDAVNGRQLKNEAEITQHLVSLGFEEVVLSEMLQADQVDLFTDARVIVGVSGSGITNHIFAPEGAHVIEFHPSNYTNRAHFFTTNLMEQTYQFVIGTPELEGGLYVPLERIKRALRRVM